LSSPEKAEGDQLVFDHFECVFGVTEVFSARGDEFSGPEQQRNDG
jgi:hypothetical protein